MSLLDKITASAPIKRYNVIASLCFFRSSSSNDSDDDIGDYQQSKPPKQRKCNPDMWKGVEVREMTHLPHGIDGLGVYKVKGSNKQVQAALLNDGRKWRKSNVTEWKDYGTMRYADCRGSLKCTNEECPYRVQYGVVNRTQFTWNSGNRGGTCRVCEQEGEYIQCNARRYLKTGSKGVKIFHCGTHSCPVLKNQAKPKEKVKEMIKNNPNLKPAEIQSAFVLSSLRCEENWDKVEKEASNILDKRWIANQKQSVKKEIHPSGENFEAIVTFKEYCDKKDKLFIYQVNDRRGKPDTPTYIFKTSKTRMTVANNMDRQGEHFMSKEYCFFDGKVKRCRNFVTLTASVYHPLIKRQIPLAIMETETESSETIELFWTLFQKAFESVSPGKQFNPLGWCTDMAGANMNGIKKVFGEDAVSRIKGCEFHFQDSRNRLARKLGDPETGEQFKKLCNMMLYAQTKEAYLEAKTKLENFANITPERLSTISNWLQWWDNRRGFMFNAFAPKGAPRMNLAEVIHAGWAHRNDPNLSLLEVAHEDVKDSILLEAELKGFESGIAKGGSGPLFEKRRQRDHQRQINDAAQLGKEISQMASQNGLLIDTTSGHRPTDLKKRKTKINKTQPQKPSEKPLSMSSGIQPLPTMHHQGPPPQPVTSQKQPQMLSSRPPSAMTYDMPPRQFTSQQQPNIGSFVPLSPMTNQMPQPNYRPQFHPNTPQQFSNNQINFTQPQVWNSGMSPHRYELVYLPSNVKKCYGCGQAFSDRLRQPPHNIIVKHIDRRLMRRDDWGNLHYSPDFTNTYYHLDVTHVRRKNPFFDGKVFVSQERFR